VAALVGLLILWALFRLLTSNSGGGGGAGGDNPANTREVKKIVIRQTPNSWDLLLSEVEVLGSTNVNYALDPANAVATQSSTYASNREASKAVDGNRDSYSETTNSLANPPDVEPSWTLTFAKPVPAAYVRVVLPGPWMDGARLTCYDDSDSDGVVMSVSLSGALIQTFSVTSPALGNLCA
jgi:hypothetical protein